MAETEFCERGTHLLQTTATQEREPVSTRQAGTGKKREGWGGSHDKPHHKGT
jgi:hypothetical protein